MKKYAFIPVIAFITLSGCAQKLNPQDRALLTETHSLAEQAKNDAAQAALDAKAAKDEAMQLSQDAKIAKEEAAKAAIAAQSASEKSDRIFQQGQVK